MEQNIRATSRPHKSVILRILARVQVKNKCGFSDFSEGGIWYISPKDKEKACKAWLTEGKKKKAAEWISNLLLISRRTLITHILFTQKSSHQNPMTITTSIHWEKFSQFVNNYFSVSYFPESLFIIGNYFYIFCLLQKMYHGFTLDIIYSTIK